ncbi:MAG: Histidine kinase [Verrucomicrobia bacterium]|nr:Histidine kinase [Verrucomicrobiota bacterium]
MRKRLMPKPAKKAIPVKAAKNGRTTSGRWISDKKFFALCDRLREAQETLDAIQSGAVDAVVVKGAAGSKIYSLTGAEERYRVYVEQMQEGAITASQDGLILYCNQRFAEMVKTPLERVISAGMANHFVAEAWDSLSTVFTEQRDVVKHESVLLCPDGSTLAVHLTASRLPALGQNILCVVVTDLTEQKSQQQLRLAKDLADKANLAKDAFLAALSHELRTPLNPALMATVALEQTKKLPPHVRSGLALIRRNIELEAHLIDDLLDLTRIAKGKLELQPGPMDLHNVVKRAMEICASDAEEKRLRFNLHLDALETMTTGDAVRLQQAVWNLIRNAIKFTPMGGQVTIRTGNTTQPSVWVEVRDSGIGFNPHDSLKLFDAFEQGSRHITRQFGGLGLAIATSILAAHGGAIRAESPGLNLGATFTLNLPLRPLASAPALPAAARSAPPKQGRRLRILLVEDHKDTRLTLQLYLQATKNDVTAAETAHEALKLAAVQEFDLVISDLGLPDEGGGCGMMRHMRDRHGLTGIAVSGYGMEEDIEKSLDAGFAHHLTKPINLERLKSLIVEVSNQK